MALLVGVFVMATPAWSEELLEAGMWESVLKDTYFKGVTILEDKDIIELTTPYRAEDAAMTPVGITAKIPQTPERFIQTIHVFVDKNPQPQVGVFHLTPGMGKADLSLRVRIDSYTNVRAVAVLNNGEHHMTANFVKATGGCSAPLGADLKAAMQRIGRMKFKTVGETKPGEPATGQLQVSHPNLTGLQMDQKTRVFTPAHYVKKIAVTYNDKPVLNADVGFSLSADPNLRFFFTPGKGGKVKVEVDDSKDMHWAQEFEVKI
jgi:sulfur-oxidizing protein SoxY